MHLCSAPAENLSTFWADGKAHVLLGVQQIKESAWDCFDFFHMNKTKNSLSDDSVSFCRATAWRSLLSESQVHPRFDLIGCILNKDSQSKLDRSKLDSIYHPRDSHELNFNHFDVMKPRHLIKKVTRPVVTMFSFLRCGTAYLYLNSIPS